MQIKFRTRELARSFKAQREANGHPTRLVDTGKKAPAGKRFACDIGIKAV